MTTIKIEREVAFRRGFDEISIEHAKEILRNGGEVMACHYCADVDEDGGHLFTSVSLEDFGDLDADEYHDELLRIAPFAVWNVVPHDDESVSVEVDEYISPKSKTDKLASLLQVVPEVSVHRQLNTDTNEYKYRVSPAASTHWVHPFYMTGTIDEAIAFVNGYWRASSIS